VESSLPVRRVLALGLVQVVGYAALLTVAPHSQPTAVVGVLDGIPTPLLLPFAPVAIPAVVIAVGLGAVLSVAGVSPTSVPALLLARGDMLVFVGSVAVGAAAVWAVERAAAR
jgi:hypothetical protein